MTYSEGQSSMYRKRLDRSDGGDDHYYYYIRSVLGAGALMRGDTSRWHDGIEFFKASSLLLLGQ